jgi:hypothetical protein
MARKNFAITTVATSGAPSPATSGTSITVTDGSVLYNGQAFAFPAGATPTRATAETITITNISTNTLTVTRNVDSGGARSIADGWVIQQGPEASEMDLLVGSAPKFRFGTIFEGSVNAGTSYETRFYTGNTGGGGAVTWSTGGASLSANTSSGGFAGLRFSTIFSGSFDLFGGNFEFTHVQSINSGTPNGNFIQACGVGFALMANAAGFTQTGKHVGWIGQYASGWTYKYSVADGTTQSTGTYSETLDAGILHYIKTNGTTSALYYKDGALLGTLASHIPASGPESVLGFTQSNMNANTTGMGTAYSMCEYAKEMY